MNARSLASLLTCVALGCTAPSQPSEDVIPNREQDIARAGNDAPSNPPLLDNFVMAPRPAEAPRPVEIRSWTFQRRGQTVLVEPLELQGQGPRLNFLGTRGISINEDGTRMRPWPQYGAISKD